MIIETVDLYYLAIPQVRDIADGSQDALLVRVRSGGHTGWGECEASPLVSIANYVCPMSHANIKPVRDGVVGATIDAPDDIVDLSRQVAKTGLDIPQNDHTWSGIEMALWDLLGRQMGQPVYKLLGCDKAYPKTPYASQLFGDTPQGYRAVKFGWGPFGRKSVRDDSDQLTAAREGLGDDAILLVDAGTAWIDDVDAAAARLDALAQAKATWLEEPFISEALQAYGQLARISAPVKIAGGEAAQNFHMAKQLIDYGGIGYVQIDAGRVGGIHPARRVAQYANSKGVTFVNHTFTTHLQLSASIQPFADIQDASLCEYPVEPASLAAELSDDQVPVGSDGQVRLPDAPGLGVIPNAAAIRKYLVDTQIKVCGTVLYTTPDVNDL